MPGISQKKFHSTIKGPAAEALDVVSPHAEEVLRAWATSIRGLGLSVADFPSDADLDFSALADALRRSSFGELHDAIGRAARRLGRRGVGIDRALAALNRLFEIC
ncbi:MAG: hypothetical protein LAO79_26865, partial [Acidobacteriia bacterium]|nr:hypothetical protein [Terriglobia bacterium]